MKRYKEKAFGNMQEDDKGVFVLHTEALEMVQSSVQFVVNHKEDILNGVDDFGKLKPLLELVIGKGNS